ncbi:hypothetical protein PHIM7_163 [Sinorhizobium phage phiM7]|uniref:Uncharacterized protein n=2 Tax=Emdodecavirus TaxID=1980937 RepID=S5MVC7_9CAUD|nr:hypothetical protein AB690_gp335 [Sinorhizobium phage phiM12]YP_009601288.1 hypothetical protein FDH46_gp315 [Sinorhizobium phage phiM7]AGR47867.1 hypothetical protein SmphiM12_235 [Sinorhizobium phage phiM12]AKF12709.1 hypothetical protein PHIM7_163 [Sinorhizobium phage phiM7]AKF13068.1 hypothetical protein PHIM19_163 [Sinorhizobium phage phiM19]
MMTRDEQIVFIEGAQERDAERMARWKGHPMFTTANARRIQHRQKISEWAESVAFDYDGGCVYPFGFAIGAFCVDLNDITEDTFLLYVVQKAIEYGNRQGRNEIRSSLANLLTREEEQ